MFTKKKTKQKKKHKSYQLGRFTVVFPYLHKSDIDYLYPPFFIALPVSRTWWEFLIGCAFMFSSPKSLNNGKIPPNVFKQLFVYSILSENKKKRGRRGGRKRERESVLLSNPLVSFPLSWGDISTVFLELTRLHAA